MDYKSVVVFRGKYKELKNVFLNKNIEGELQHRHYLFICFYIIVALQTWYGIRKICSLEM